MEISSINSNINNNTLNNTKDKVADADFEKRLKAAAAAQDEKELKKVCKDFEGILLNMLYKQMKATVPKSELTTDDPAKEIFDSMLDEKLMDEASKSNGVGLADVLYKQLSKQNKAENKTTVEGEVAVEVESKE